MVSRVLEYLRRVAQVAAVAGWAMSLAAQRKLRGQPVMGHELLRESLEKLSGSFLKFGQILSLQVDALPMEYCDALLNLLDRVPPFSAEEATQVLREELGAAPSALFREFHFTPLASASIGQVHRAALHDGTAVAVKVQRPGIRRIFEIDTKLLEAGVRLIVLFRLRRFYFMRDPVSELKTWTEDELDYRREAANCMLLAGNAFHRATERVPDVYWKLTTPRVLTMDYLEGPSVSAYLRMVAENDQAGMAALRQQGFDPKVFSSNVISNFLSDAFHFGVFHADLHPANLLILPNNVVGYVDFGIVATLTQEARRKQIELTLAYASGDPHSIYESFLNICKFGEDADLEGLRRRIEQFTNGWYEPYSIGGRVRFRVPVTRTMMDLLSVCQDYHVLVDREMIKYIRSTLLADGLVSRIARGVDLAQVLRGVVEQYLAEETQQRVLSRGGLLSLLTDAAVWAGSGPGPLLHALSRLERRQLRLRVPVDHRAGGGHARRMRAIAAAIVWVSVVAGLSSWTDYSHLRENLLYSGVVGCLVVAWGLWLLLVVRQLLVR